MALEEWFGTLRSMFQNKEEEIDADKLLDLLSTARKRRESYCNVANEGPRTCWVGFQGPSTQ